jgi:SPASM domain peptide maturase of grasp-with-spasm system
MNKQYFNLFANCIPVKGAKRSVVCDLQRNQFDFIPNDLLNILEEIKTTEFSKIKEPLSDEDAETLDEYFDFLVKKEYGFWCSKEELELFPQLDLSFVSPSIITNAIIDVDSQSNHDFTNIYNQLNDLGCKDLQIRFFSQTSLDELIEIIRPLLTNRIRSLQLVIQATAEFTEEKLIALCKRNMKIINVIISGSPEDKTVMVGLDSYTSLNFIKQSIDSCGNCGNIHHTFFATNIQSFAESLHYNSCLNQKISVDINGDIKNCPSIDSSYGNISTTHLKDALRHPDFKKIWGIHKDQIEECMDCEFRHICTDCRAYLSKPRNKYSKPLKCTYDPYTATWQDSRLNIE